MAAGMVTSTNQPSGTKSTTDGVFLAPLPLFNKAANQGATRNPPTDSVLVRSATTMSGAEEEA